MVNALVQVGKNSKAETLMLYVMSVGKRQFKKYSVISLENLYFF
jgi:hypothetical protein